MAYEKNETGLLVDVRPVEAKRKILAAYKAAKCHEATAAEKLGAVQSTFRRWVTKLGIAAELKEMRQRARDEGWYAETRGRKKAA